MGLIVTDLDGNGVRVSAHPQIVEIVMSWDGAERMTIFLHPDDLIEIAEEARDHHVQFPVVVNRCKHIDCNLEAGD